ncbi:hypothetical protein WJX72_002493 [[Myrmecia] bisecta]|uniref:Uncharacterized protein n=1 Tax=[Myrmecia] bisecta TaxID=41462 RepID=A0AAW1R561_9CHLO
MSEGPPGVAMYPMVPCQRLRPACEVPSMFSILQAFPGSCVVLHDNVNNERIAVSHFGEASELPQSGQEVKRAARGRPVTSMRRTKEPLATPMAAGIGGGPTAGASNPMSTAAAKVAETDPIAAMLLQNYEDKEALLKKYMAQ